MSDCSFDLCSPIVALSLSPDKTLLAVGGRESIFFCFLLLSLVFKILHVPSNVSSSSLSTSFTLAKNVRNARSNLNSSTNDVKWHPHGAYAQIVCSAAMNGSIVVWNLEGTAATNQGKIMQDNRKSCRKNILRS